MKFGKSLNQSIYGPWREYYIDYKKLKNLLHEDEEERQWKDEDEERFVDELVNVQLEKINEFQKQTYRTLKDRTSQCETKLEQYVANSSNDATIGGDDTDFFNGIIRDLDGIRQEITRLERFSRINYTGALKAAKKHDRRRGNNYKVRPLLQVRLAALPFNSEDYSPLLYRLSAMYSFVRENSSGKLEKTASNVDPQAKAGSYTSYKFFVHPDNLLEVKTSILRHLPVLVYTPQSNKIAEGIQDDPTITSLYFDNPTFSLYSGKLEKGSGASSLRIRWYGQLQDKPELVMEKKTLTEGSDSEEIRFSIKNKYVTPFIQGEYKMEKQIEKMAKRNGEDSSEVQQFKKSVDDIKRFIKKDGLEPILRANYTRTAFQIPGADKVRISLDTNLAFIREDSLDAGRHCRNPEIWHREDIDDAGKRYPFDGLAKGELSKFPYALLEIKVRDSIKRKNPEWVDDLMSSHLIQEAPRFSKFVHGVASLFEDHINSLPFWMSLLETDIRKDPEQAFEEEQERKAKQAEDEMAIGSFMGSKSSLSKMASSPAKYSPARQPMTIQKSTDQASASRSQTISKGHAETNSQDQLDGEGNQARPGVSRLRSFLPAFSSSKYALAKKRRIELPPGVREPAFWIKDVGPVRVEPKVWLANQRTFIKWCHIAILLSGLSISLYNSAGVHNDVARALAVVYTVIALFAGLWGWYMYVSRSKIIRKRSGEDLYNTVGPSIVCVSLIVALCVNFVLRYRSMSQS